MLKKTILALAVALAIAGCADTAVLVKSEGQRIDRGTVNEIRPGVTTRQAVLDAFGRPSDVKREGGEEKLVFSHSETKVPTYLGGLVENEDRKRTVTTTLEVTLVNDLVTSYKYTTEEK